RAEREPLEHAVDDDVDLVADERRGPDPELARDRTPRDEALLADGEPLDGARTRAQDDAVLEEARSDRQRRVERLLRLLGAGRGREHVHHRLRPRALDDDDARAPREGLALDLA